MHEQCTCYTDERFCVRWSCRLAKKQQQTNTERAREKYNCDKRLAKGKVATQTSKNDCLALCVVQQGQAVSFVVLLAIFERARASWSDGARTGKANLLEIKENIIALIGIAIRNFPLESYRPSDSVCKTFSLHDFAQLQTINFAFP